MSILSLCAKLELCSLCFDCVSILSLCFDCVSILSLCATVCQSCRCVRLCVNPVAVCESLLPTLVISCELRWPSLLHMGASPGTRL